MVFDSADERFSLTAVGGEAQGAKARTCLRTGDRCGREKQVPGCAQNENFFQKFSHKGNADVAGSGCGEGGGGFEVYGAGKEDVGFEVGVLAEVVLELLEAGVEDAVGEADSGRRGVVVA